VEMYDATSGFAIPRLGSIAACVDNDVCIGDL
jgi:hypothetical protein